MKETARKVITACQSNGGTKTWHTMTSLQKNAQASDTGQKMRSTNKQKSNCVGVCKSSLGVLNLQEPKPLARETFQMLVRLQAKLLRLIQTTKSVEKSLGAREPRVRYRPCLVGCLALHMNP